MSNMDDIIDKMRDGTIEASMIVMLTSDGERIYLHHFDDELSALSYLEQMTASYRMDVIENLFRRGMN